jgi:hypothetical protein
MSHARCPPPRTRLPPWHYLETIGLLILRYSAAHFTTQSPRILLLHSILGVASNYFAMRAGQIPKLRSLVSAHEFEHIEAFPSVLRLLVIDELLTALQHGVTAGLQLRRLTFFRVIDNTPLEMDGKTFWTHLNFQLIHLLDFLPVADWAAAADERFFVVFRSLCV